MDKLYRYYITGIVTFTDKDKQEGTMMVNLFLNSDNADKITKPVFQAMHQACAKQYVDKFVYKHSGDNVIIQMRKKEE